MVRTLQDLVGMMVGFDDPTNGLKMAKVLSIGPKWVRLRNPYIKSRKKGAGVRKLLTSTIVAVMVRKKWIELTPWLRGE